MNTHVDPNALRRKRGEAIEQMEALNKSAIGEGGKPRKFTDEEKTQFDKLRAEVEDLDEAIERAETVEREKAREAKPLIPAAPKEKKEPGTDFARITFCLIKGGGNAYLGAQIAQEMPWDNKADIAKALGISDATAGGVLVQGEQAQEVIELLRTESVVMRAGPRVLPMRGTLTVPRLTGGVNGSYIGENTNIPSEQQTFGDIVLTSKKLAALVPVSNDLLNLGGPMVDQTIRDDLVSGLATTQDTAFIRDVGDGAAPKGLRYQAAAANLLTKDTAGSTTADKVENDFSDLVNALTDANVRMISPVWFMAPRVRNFLYKLRDANGNLIYPEVRDVSADAPWGRMYGWPIFCTNNIPINLGGGSETEIYLVDMADVVVGEEQGIQIMVSQEAAYHDGSQVQAAFSKDQTVVRAILKHDLGLRHQASVAVKTDIDWAA